MHQIASGLNMSKHESCFDIVIANCDHHHGSVEWFIQGNTFLKWELSDGSDLPGSLLWVHGKRQLISQLLRFGRD